MVSNNNEMKQHLIVGEKYLQVYSAGGDLVGEVVLPNCFLGLLLAFPVASVVGVAVMGTSIHMETQNIIHHFTPPV